MTLEINREVRYLAETLKLAPGTTQLAGETHQEAQKRGLARGRSLRVMAAASVFVAMRLRGEPAKFADLVEASGERQRTIMRSYALLVHKLGLQIPNARPSLMVTAIAAALGLSDAAVERAVLLAERAEGDVAGGGCDPRGVAAAAVYYTGLGVVGRFGAFRKGEDYRKQETVARAARITGVTLRSRLMVLERVFELVPMPEAPVSEEI
jgi:transcription initiation factor TFIIIB Brf1 subunit/transcription initiation factor TFIIB